MKSKATMVSNIEHLSLFALTHAHLYVKYVNCVYFYILYEDIECFRCDVIT